MLETHTNEALNAPLSSIYVLHISSFIGLMHGQSLYILGFHPSVHFPSLHILQGAGTYCSYHRVKGGGHPAWFITGLVLDLRVT